MKLRIELKNVPICLTILGICTAVLFSCKPDQATLPVVSTTTATNIIGSAAVSGGTVTDDGGTSVTARGMCWGTSANPTLDDSISVVGQGIGIFTDSIHNLQSFTTYFVRAYATNSVGTSYGKTISFKTIYWVSTVPTVSNITGTSAISGGFINEEGSVIAKGVCWGTNTSPTIYDNKTTDGTGLGSFTSNITGLTPNTTYFVRAYATSNFGTEYGRVIGFTTTKLAKATNNLTF